MRSRRRSFLFHAKRDKLLPRSFFFCCEQNVTSDEIWFCHVDEKSETCLDRISFWRQIRAVQRVAHFQAQRVAGAQTARLDRERLAFFEHGVPKLHRVCCAKENFNPVLAGVTGACDRNSRSIEWKIGNRIARWKIRIGTKESVK